jgi:hypothetical protein
VEVPAMAQDFFMLRGQPGLAAEAGEFFDALLCLGQKAPSHQGTNPLADAIREARSW